MGSLNISPFITEGCQRESGSALGRYGRSAETGALVAFTRSLSENRLRAFLRELSDCLLVELTLNTLCR